MTATPNTAALQALLMRVEAGDIPLSDLDPFIPAFGMTTTANDAHMAYRGSLDAAKALHKAVLPGYRFRVEDFRAEIWYGPTGPFIEASEIPARAWLIAILRALIAQAPVPEEEK